MKKNFTKIAALFGFLIIGPQAFAEEEAKAPDLGAIVGDYLNAWAAINQLDTDMDDYKYYNTFFTEDISYEIPEFDMVFQGEDFLSGEPSGSGRVRNSENTIDKMIIGKNVVFLKMNGKADMRRSEEDDWQTISRPDFLVIVFEGDKIKRIIDY